MILALDLGTNVGVTYDKSKSWEDFTCETWTLATREEIHYFGKQRLNRRCDPRVIRFHEKLKALSPRPDIVVFEDVQFSSSTYQVQLWSAFRTVVWLTFSDCLIDCVPVSTLKKFATRHGGSPKSAMSAALKNQYPNLWTDKLDDNAIDSVWIWLWAAHTFSRICAERNQWELKEFYDTKSR